VKFCSYFHKRLVYSNKKNLESTGAYISESLTRINFHIFNEAKKVFSRENVWTRDGRILVKVGDRKHTVTSMRQLKELFRIPSTNLVPPVSRPPVSNPPPTLPPSSTPVRSDLDSSFPLTPIIEHLISDTSTSFLTPKTPVNNVKPPSGSRSGSSKSKGSSRKRKRRAQRW
ncbi:hypothetical protein WDU94_010743, partial [Cyamophila willieti]